MDKEVSTAAIVLNRHDNEKDEKGEIQEREEIVKLWKHMDETLEIKAKSLNLTAINVKTILHHMMKNPHVISIIMGLDKNCAIADLKLTRSKTKRLSAREAHFDLKEKDVTVSRASRTFLNVSYDSSEEDDDDYFPEQDANEREVTNKADTAGISCEGLTNALQVKVSDHGSGDGGDNDDGVAPALHTRSKQRSNIFLEDVGNFSDDVLLYTAVDDPEYVEFISNLNDPTKYDLDETEDPEYNFLSDADAEDITEEYEIRKDRATEIPLREVENLLQDLLEARLLPSPEHLEQVMDSAKDENEPSQATKQSDHKLIMKKTKAVLTGLVPENNEPATIFVGASQDDFQKVSTNSSSLLCSSIENPPFFSFYELQQLIAQLEKHVQLLTQFAVGCYFNNAMIKIYNAFQVMINELNDYCLKRPEHSLFNVLNLEACITTCHDAIECESINDFIDDQRKSRKPRLPLSKTMFVLSRSAALLFPELLPQVRMEVFPSFYPYFIREEECLLALGLYQFAHLKQFYGKSSGKLYALINQHLLANKTQSQIRLHLKNFRYSNRPLHTLFVGAETGTIDMIFPLENRSTAIFGPPYLWPSHLQPIWLKELIDKQRHDIDDGNLALDGLTFVKITNEQNSASMDRLDSDHSALRRTFDGKSTSKPIALNATNRLTEHVWNSTSTSEPVNTTIASIDSENTGVDGDPLSAVRNLLLFASTPVSEVTSSLSPSTSDHSGIVSSVSRDFLEASSQYSMVVSSAESADFVRNVCTTKPVRLAPFKKMPSTEVKDMNECEGSRDSNQYEMQITDGTDESLGSNMSDNGFVDSSSSNLKTSICLERFPPRMKRDCCDGASSHVNTADFNFSWSVESDKQQENEMNRHIPSCSPVFESNKKVCSVAKVKWISNTSNGDINSSDPVSSPVMFCAQNKATQCDLSVSNSFTSMARMLEYGGSGEKDSKAQIAQCDSSANCIRTFESVHSNSSDFAQSNENGGTQKGQNEQIVSNNGSQSNEIVRNEQHLPVDAAGGSKLPGDRERDGSDGEENGSIDEEKRRKRVRTRKDRVRDGLHGMLDARHRALQIKCMAHVIFNDFEQRMFMYQDKVRALCELIAEDSMCAEMFERMHNIFEEEHEPMYFLLSFLFPQNLLPASVLENPIRKAYSNALEMIYNIEAFTSFGNTRLSARTIFRNVRDLGFDCTCEALTTRLSGLIGNKGPLWEIISQNIPTRVCRSNYSVMDFEYVDLCSWRKVDAPFENVDLTIAIGAQTEKERSGVFVGFLRNLFTEKKGKLYEVVAEWKQTKITPRGTSRRRPPAKRAKKRKYKAPNKMEITKLSRRVMSKEIPDTSRSSDALTIISPVDSVTASHFVRKRSIPQARLSETRKKRNKCDDIQIKQNSICTENDNISSIEMDHITDSGENLDGCSENGADISLGNVVKEEIADGPLQRVGSREIFVQCSLPSPDIVNPTRKWTIEEDRKILHVHQKNGLDLDLTLASAQLELPGISVDELKQRLIFLLNILEHVENSK